VVGTVNRIVERTDWSTSPQACYAQWLVQSTELSKEQTGRPVPKHFMLGGRCSQPNCRKNRLVDQSPSMLCSVVGTVNRIVERIDWSTSPRAFYARWSVQSTKLLKEQTDRPVPEHIMLGGRYSQPNCRKNRLVDQSPSMLCSVIGTVNRIVKRTDWSTSPQAFYARWPVQSTELSKEQTGRPVPEHVMLGGRYSQPNCRKNRLVDQSRSILCSVVGAVVGAKADLQTQRDKR